MVIASPRFPVDLSLFDGVRHSPSLPSLERTLGQGHGKLQDFCIPVNPYFPTPEIFADLAKRLETILKYYPGGNESVARSLAGALGLDPATVVMGNGSTELITWIDLLLVKDGLATPVPTFGRWTDHPEEVGQRVRPWPLKAEEDFRLDVDAFAAFVRRVGAGAAAVCNPNNPTGACLCRGAVLRLLDALADRDLVVIDESFLDFADEDEVPSVADEAARRANVLVLKSLGKNLGLHGLRAGYAVAHPRLAAKLREALPPWNVNALAEALILELRAHLAEYEAARRRTVADRRGMEQRLRSVPGLTVFPSRANFVYVRIPEPIDGVALRNWLLCEHGYLVRECGNKLGSDSRHFRLAVRPPEQGEALVGALASAFGQADRMHKGAWSGGG